MSDADVQNLLRMIAENDDLESFKKLYFHFYHRLSVLAKFYIKSMEVAEEVVDDAFVAIWENRRQLISIDNFNFYTYKIVKNKCLNHLSKAKPPVCMDIEEMIVEVQDMSPNVEQKILAADLDRQINMTISKLPEQCGLVFKLIREDGFRHKEVAELLNVSVRTVEYHMSTALKKLAESLRYYPKVTNSQKL